VVTLELLAKAPGRRNPRASALMSPLALMVYQETLAPTVTRSRQGPAGVPVTECATGVDGAVGTSSVRMAAEGPVPVIVTTSAGVRCSI
jgi:hypothetical protein